MRFSGISAEDVSSSGSGRFIETEVCTTYEVGFPATSTHKLSVRGFQCSKGTVDPSIVDVSKLAYKLSFDDVHNLLMANAVVANLYKRLRWRDVS